MTTTEEPSRATDVPSRSPRFERPSWPPAGPRRVIADFGGTYAANGLIGLIFSATGPVAVILAAGSAGGLSPSQMASWIFGVFFLNGLLTALCSWLYRQPLAFFWTIPGTIIVGASLTHLAWAEVLGAFLVTGFLVLALGLTGRVRQVMSMLPMPIVMAMVAGVFLRFGTDLVAALKSDALVAVPMVVVFLLLGSRARWGRWMPPILGALLVGAVAVAATGRFRLDDAAHRWIAEPVWQAPHFTWAAITELVIPLAVTVIVVQNGQGSAVLKSAGHTPPMNVATVACGIWSVAASTVGAVSSCLTGPTNALLVASGVRSRQYTAAIVCGILAMVVGVFAPVFVQLMLATPAAFVATLGGLAMLKALQGSFVAAFGGRFTLGALVTFLVTVSSVQYLNIGAAFWGLLAGLLVSRLMEPEDFRPT
ncbi:benzoate/H(+) symporter BenE family transporter [Rhodococcus tibetensis]|uniref:Benzoate/H(+) symporter BenE family transporter n=1 Tax=Rhodococcus tibetensis TaxID=2965064 RepID=A0ABT1Q8R0_9NOCA|nr:benzoate/H(+) symporter BenE family transporter [Rhodococcus sp. FXJ9.536]MCQ4118125.1 benzoate/H(+) symporter BenE family transporter [Rhodococcus sp. FXJ9.536]